MAKTKGNETKTKGEEPQKILKPDAINKVNIRCYKYAFLMMVGVLVGSLVMIGCDPIEHVQTGGEVSFDNSCTGNAQGRLQTVEYEGHRYVICTVYRGAGICHAGDCPCRGLRKH